MTWLLGRERLRAPFRSIRYAVGAVIVMAFAPFPAHTQSDRLVREIIRKAEARNPEDGFCRRSAWRTPGPRAQQRFLENAVVHSDEAARFEDGACSYTRVDETYRGRYGKCVRYTWWACEPGTTCATGKTAWCKQRNGTFKVEPS